MESVSDVVSAPEPEPELVPEDDAEGEEEPDDPYGETVMMQALPSQEPLPESGPEPLTIPEPVVEAEPAPKRSSLVMVAGPGVEAFVAEPEPEPEEAPQQDEEPYDPNPQPIMVAGPKRNV